MPVKASDVRLRYALALTLLTACGPESSGDDGLPADDMEWLIDSFAYGGADPITQCTAAHYYEFVFELGGTLQTYDIVCGVREPAQMERQGRWRPTDEYGIAEILPRDGEESFKATLQSIERALVQRSDDCTTVDLDVDADGIYDILLYRGSFHYVASACESKAVYLGDSPVCSNSVESD